MSSAPYTPRPGSLPDMVCQYMRDNRGAELTAGQIARLFGVPNTNVRSGLMMAIEAGLLARHPDPLIDRWTYTAGPRLEHADGRDDQPPPARTASAALQQVLASAWR